MNWQSQVTKEQRLGLISQGISFILQQCPQAAPVKAQIDKSLRTHELNAFTRSSSADQYVQQMNAATGALADKVKAKLPQATQQPSRIQQPPTQIMQQQPPPQIHQQPPQHQQTRPPTQPQTSIATIAQRSFPLNVSQQEANEYWAVHARLVKLKEVIEMRRAIAKVQKNGPDEIKRLEAYLRIIQQDRTMLARLGLPQTRISVQTSKLKDVVGVLEKTAPMTRQSYADIARRIQQQKQQQLQKQNGQQYSSSIPQQQPAQSQQHVPASLLGLRTAPQPMPRTQAPTQQQYPSSIQSNATGIQQRQEIKVVPQSYPQSQSYQLPISTSVSTMSLPGSSTYRPNIPMSRSNQTPQTYMASSAPSQTQNLTSSQAPSISNIGSSVAPKVGQGAIDVMSRLAPQLPQHQARQSIPNQSLHASIASQQSSGLSTIKQELPTQNIQVVSQPSTMSASNIATSTSIPSSISSASSMTPISTSNTIKQQSRSPILISSNSSSPIPHVSTATTTTTSVSTTSSKPQPEDPLKNLSTKEATEKIAEDLRGKDAAPYRQILADKLKDNVNKALGNVFDQDEDLEADFEPLLKKPKKMNEQKSHALDAAQIELKDLNNLGVETEWHSVSDTQAQVKLKLASDARSFDIFLELGSSYPRQPPKLLREKSTNVNQEILDQVENILKNQQSLMTVTSLAQSWKHHEDAKNRVEEDNRICI